MKKRLFSILASICVLCTIKADVVSYTFNFSESDFAITATETDSLAITSIKGAAAYPEPTEPWIPIIGKNIALSADQTVKNINYTISKRLIRGGVDLKNAPMAIPTSMSIDDVITPPGGYEAKLYPNSNCTLSKCYQIGGVNVASFLVSPFVFDAAERNLYFVDSLQVDLEIETSMARNIIPGTTASQMELLEATVENTSFLDRVDITLPPVEEDDYCEYLIITRDNYKAAFQPLADWKRKKGVPSKIITVEEINSNYSGDTRQIRIKKCIKDMSENYGVQFVLLGGDVEYIPPQYCFVKATASVEGTVPTDMYYSCLTDVDWDSNENPQTGELFDYVDVVPTIFVTRASVTNPAEVTTFVNRIIQYEQAPNFRAGLLQAGAMLDHVKTGKAYADSIFYEVINGKIRMETSQFFDTYTYNGEAFSLNNFSNELNKGFQFVEIISHGREDKLKDLDEIAFCNRNSVSSLNNIGHSLVTTIACFSNAFDRYTSEHNPCLSEAWFRNPNSGLIGYLGSTREGWYNGGTIPRLELSFSYEKDFYERLLNTETLAPRIKHFGALVNYIKHTHLCFYNEEGTYRWLHFAINALGDPETPIFNTYPIENTSATAELDENGNLVINAGVDGAKVCISSADSVTYYEICDERISSRNLFHGLYDIWIHCFII